LHKYEIIKPKKIEIAKLLQTTARFSFRMMNLVQKTVILASVILSSASGLVEVSTTTTTIMSRLELRMGAAG
jgi:hypothetical protein